MTAEARFPASFWLQLLGIPLLFFAVMYFVDGRTLVAPQWFQTDGYKVLSESEAPPPPEAAWEPARMTDLHSGQRSDLTSYWWRYEVPPAAQAPGAHWLVVIPFPRLVYYELWFNGERYDSRGDPDFPMLRRPIHFSVTNSPRSSGPQQLHLYTRTGTTGLLGSPVLIGPEPELRHYLTYIQLTQRYLPLAVMAMMLMMAGIIGSVYLLRQQRDPLFGWYAVTLLAWTLHLSHVLIEAPPFGDAPLWIALSYMTLGWFTFASTLFVHCVLGLRTQRLAWLLGGWALFGLIFPYLIRDYSDLATGFLFYIWVPSLLALNLYLLFRLVYGCLRQPTRERRALLVLTFFLFLVGLRDFAYNNLDIIPGNVLYLRFAAALGLLVFSILLIRRFVSAFETAEQLNVTLEQRVQEKANLLDEQYRKTKNMERQQLLNDERQRLLREMHDGLGGHLVHALAVAEREPALQPMAPQLKLALEDLRLILDSLDPEESAFGAVFSSLRARFAATAAGLGLRFRWEVASAIDDLALNPHVALTLGRIVQEAVTNVIKHARASRLEVTGTLREGTLEFAISDDGVGLPKAPSNGRGLTNMRSRVAELGGTLSIKELHPGIVLRVTCPVPVRQQAAPS